MIITTLHLPSENQNGGLIAVPVLVRVMIGLLGGACGTGSVSQVQKAGPHQVQKADSQLMPQQHPQVKGFP